MSAPATSPVRAGHHPPARWRAARAPLAVGAGAAAVAATLVARSPHVPGGYGFCPFRAVLGVWCPGCGGLRAAHDLLHGDLAGAWDMNPLAVVAVPLLVGAWVWWLARAWRGRPVPTPSGRAVAALGVVLAAFTVARNLPVLAPYLAP